MAAFQATRRHFIQGFGGASVLTLFGCNRREQAMVRLYTFGDSILNCGRYNEFGVHPGQLLVQNDDRLFPEFQGQDLISRGPAQLEHRARDGATVDNLPSQAHQLRVEGRTMPAAALITIGGNDLLRGLIKDTGAGITIFANALDTFVQQLPIRPVVLGNVYDPTFGDDRRNFVGVEPAIARKNLQRMNTEIQQIANRYGQLVDLHAHFLKGDPSWFTATIEPSLQGASEVRRAFLPYVLGK
ncbi:SGNH/GDSL hydrolase family protein [Nostoc flagelliforme FACHB-838]|uniref:SGNH/GDSL hydrolase family protein n=1 Tax=Nostoc flagelliforme FACHB-838 TaxID=2692904 RepID=A0ABR8DU91_9NOSO|nr:SGNH/GDSL hydrolase family protein [Nostoc flagelliforme]MBD2532437.1 SGNH/GDSL hydrolase family protein [Nostoc flagelliforme FACHB-838]